MKAKRFQKMGKSYSYIPAVKHKFLCRVPLEGIRQSLMVDGVLQQDEGVLKQSEGGVSQNEEVLREQGLSQNEYMGAKYMDNKYMDNKYMGAKCMDTKYMGNKCMDTKCVDTKCMGAKWVVPPHLIVESPIQLISVRTPEHREALSFANEWIIGEGAEAKMLMCDHTLSFDHFTTTQQTHIHIGAGARFELIVLQNEHNESAHRSDFQVNLEQDAFFRCTFVSLHGGRLENHIEMHLNHAGATCEANGLSLADGTQRIDFYVKALHHAPQCTSNQLFKSILDYRARALFEGMIHVAPGAQKTQAYQANHNLLLTRESKIFTRPQLEIYADDVKCSHGATVGRLDESALFYLRSRGISLKEARIMQQLAFLHDVLAQISIAPLRDRLLDLVERRLRGAFSQCGDCSMHCC